MREELISFRSYVEKSITVGLEIFKKKFRKEAEVHQKHNPERFRETELITFQEPRIQTSHGEASAIRNIEDRTL